MTELVVFDMAGTTVHDGDAVSHAFCAAFADIGIVPDAASVNAVMGLPKPEAIRRLFAECRQIPGDGQIASVHADFVRRMMDYYAIDPAVREVPGAAAVFAKLRGAGIKVALNTGFSRPIVSVLLARLGWAVPTVIDAVVSSDEVPRGRPFPDMIRLLMRQVGIDDARRVAKVGDTAADLEEGAHADCGLNIGVTSGSCSLEQLKKFSHTHIVPSIADVPRIILG